MEAGFCIEAVKEALAKHGTPEFFNTDSHMMVTSSRVVCPSIPIDLTLTHISQETVHLGHSAL
jgi:hypothetical protein